MNRVLLVVVVVALAIGGWLLFRTEKSDPPAPTVSTQKTPPAAAPSTSSEPAPSLPRTADPVQHPASQDGSAKEYMIGDVLVRDHRSGSNAPLDIPPNIHLPNTRQIPSTLTSAVAQKVRAVLGDCTKDLPKEARGAHPRLEGQVIVAIKDHQLTVTHATMQLRDVSGDAQETTRQCIEQHTVGLQTPATDQDDLDNYSIGVTFAVL
jgi:hypothetical protein